jgi:carbonic anhydrase/acetyltransferase-like protein (isoleucine patch superfamily)
MIYKFKNLIPKIDTGVYIAPSADIIGDVQIGAHSSIWFNVTIRGDVHYIKIGAETNIQDNSMLHVTNGRFPLNVGNRVTVAHSVTLHGCTIHDDVLIGMNATILDDCEIGSSSIVAAGSLVRESNKYPQGVLIAGTPARIIRDLTEAERKKNLTYAQNYVKYKEEYMTSDNLQPIISGG